MDQRPKKSTHAGPLRAQAFHPCFCLSERDKLSRGERRSTLADSEAPRVNLLKHWDAVRMWCTCTHTHTHRVSQTCTATTNSEVFLPGSEHQGRRWFITSQIYTNTHEKASVYKQKCTKGTLLFTHSTRKTDGHTPQAFTWISFLETPALRFSFLCLSDSNCSQSVLLGGNLFYSAALSKWTRLKASEQQ